MVGAGLNVPKHEPIRISEWEGDSERIMARLEEKLGFPMVVKPSREGCSTAVAKVGDKKSLQMAVTEALEWDNLALAEEYIDAMEITCTILGNDDPEALPPTETPKQGDFLTVEEKFLPGNASMITPPTGMDEATVAKVKKEFVKAYKALNLSIYARIDGFWRDGKLIILEPNTLPGVTPSTMVFHQAAEAGMNPSQFFDRIVELSVEAFEKKIGPR